MRTRKDEPKWMKLAPAAGAVGGGTLGALKPGSAIAGGSKSRLAAALLGAGIGATTGWLPSVFRTGYKAVKGKKKKSLRKTAEKRDMPSFTRQDRPEKVKEIYRALKREHPDMPAEMKARIAARQGKKGKQRQGPPYKAPIKPWKEKSAGLTEARKLRLLEKLAGARGEGVIIHRNRMAPVTKTTLELPKPAKQKSSPMTSDQSRKAFELAAKASKRTGSGGKGAVVTAGGEQMGSYSGGASRKAATTRANPATLWW